MKINKFLTILLVSIFLFSACNDDDPVIPIMVNFSNTELGLTDEVAITVTFSRPLEASGMVDISVDAPELNYGSDLDYYTDPAAESGIVSMPYAVGDESITLTIKAGSALNIQEDKTITLSLVEEEILELGDNVEAVVTVSENFVALEGTMEINGGGAEFPNQAYIDLSKLTQTVVDKYSWDLGFYSEADQFYVRLNSSAAVMARPLDASDLNAISAQDTVGFAFEMTVPPPNFDSSIGSSSWVDTPDGSLATTAFGEISSMDSDNKVFIIKRDGADRPWKKVRVLRSASGYTVQYAAIDATEFTTVEVSKDPTYNFVTFDFEEGIVNAEPQKDSWDIMYSTYTEILSLGPGASIPYLFSDFVLLNTGSTSVSMVMISDIAYENFSAADISSLTFETAKDALGENWRQGGGPGQAPSLYADRYFIVEDGEGHHYKLKFTQLLDGNGERGNPTFELALVQ